MKEYWINVYRYQLSVNEQFIGARYTNREDALDMAFVTGACIYRIHVKMDGGYSKNIRASYHNSFKKEFDKQNWME